jgi:S-adenosylmethionine decarboxylase
LQNWEDGFNPKLHLGERMNKNAEKIKLDGFNNLAKSLCLNFYDIQFVETLQERSNYLKQIQQDYGSEQLALILREVSRIIGATILNLSTQEYEPQACSLTLLIAEKIPEQAGKKDGENVKKHHYALGHLDKSHIAAHTYPENQADKNIQVLRLDMDISTCGEISPLKALNYLLTIFKPKVAVCDYRVRGFTRDIYGQKVFLDENLGSIQDYIAPELKRKYDCRDVNLQQENIFHTKMRNKGDGLGNEAVLFEIEREIREIYEGKIYKMENQSC